MIVETKRLILRKITIEDAEFVLRLVNEPSFVSNIGDKGLKNLHDAERFILEGYWTNQERSGYGMFLVELKGGGHSIGGCGLLYRKVLDVTDIGFAFLPEYWNRGFAYEAAEAIMEYGHSTLGVKKIVGLTSEDNLGSINLLKKLGIEIQEFYLHVHNNHGEEDSHNPVRDGTIDFEQLFERFDKWQVAPIAATEIYGQGLIESIDYLEKKMATTRCYGNT